MSSEFTNLYIYAQVNLKSVSSEVKIMDTKYKNASAMFMTILMLTSILMLYVPTEAEAQIMPEIDVTTGESITLDVSPRGTGLGQTTVTVSNSAVDATVRVRVTIDVPGYEVSPQYATISVGPSSDKTINVAVAALIRTPYKKSAANVFAEVTHVNGFPAGGVSEAQGGFFVLSEPYGKVILQSERPFQKVKPGKEYPFQIKVVNNGNAVDTFAIEILNKEDLHKKGFSISLSSTTTANTDPQAYDVITVQMQTPREWGWKNDYYNLDMKATSEVEGQKSEYSLTIWVYGFGIAGFEPLYSVFALAMIAAFLAKRKEENEK